MNDSRHSLMAASFTIACVASFVVTAFTAIAEPPSTKVELSQVPLAVLKTIQADPGFVSVGTIECDKGGGEVTYDAEITTRSGQQRNITVTDSGTLVSREVMLMETPELVRAAILNQLAGCTLDGIDETFDGDDASYDVEMVAKDGLDRNFTVEEDGTMSRLEMSVTQTPAAVQATVKDKLGADSWLESIEKVIDQDGITYEAHRTLKDGQGRNFTMGFDGKLLSEQVTLDETTPAARKTIKNKIGDGKILWIGKSYEMKKNVMPFEVEGFKDGQPFDFSVGPGGKFLGIDD